MRGSIEVLPTRIGHLAFRADPCLRRALRGGSATSGPSA
jgi:hypothetical protein